MKNWITGIASLCVAIVVTTACQEEEEENIIRQQVDFVIGKVETERVTSSSAFLLVPIAPSPNNGSEDSVVFEMATESDITPISDNFRLVQNGGYTWKNGSNIYEATIDNLKEKTTYYVQARIYHQKQSYVRKVGSFTTTDGLDLKLEAFPVDDLNFSGFGITGIIKDYARSEGDPDSLEISFTMSRTEDFSTNYKNFFTHKKFAANDTIALSIGLNDFVSSDIHQYTTEIKSGTTYYCRLVANVDYWEKYYSNVVSFTTPDLPQDSIIGLSSSQGKPGNEIMIHIQHRSLFSLKTSELQINLGNHTAAWSSTSKSGVGFTIPEDIPEGSYSVSFIYEGTTYSVPGALIVVQYTGIQIADFSPKEGQKGEVVKVDLLNVDESDNFEIKFSGQEANIISRETVGDIVRVTVTAPENLAFGFSYTIQAILGEDERETEEKFYVLESKWQQVANLPGGIREGAVSFSIGSYGYVGLGIRNDGPQKDFYRYDSSNDSWRKIADFPGGNRYDAVAFAVGNKAYVGTGTPDAYDNLNDFYEYDPATDSWQQVASLGTDADGRSSAVAFSTNDYGYVTTGRNGGNLKNDVWKFNPNDGIAGSWTKLKNDFTGQARENATAFVVNGNAYVGTGNVNSLVALSSMYKFDPNTEAWTKASNFGGDHVMNAVGFNINGKGYIGTGFDSEIDRQTFMYEYNASTDTWLKTESFSGEARGAAVGFVIDGEAYIGTGSGTSFTNDDRLDDFWKFKP